MSVDWLKRARHEANAAIRAWAEAQPAEKVKFVDAATLVPFERGGLWEPDGLHMSESGYRCFGTRLKIVPVISRLQEPAGIVSSVNGQSETVRFISCWAILRMMRWRHS